MKRIKITLTVASLFISGAAFSQTTSNVITDSTSNSKVDSDANSRTIVISPPPSAITPSVTSSSSDLCTVGVAGAVQTQILGISSGETVRDPNCERLKISKTLYDMSMKVAAVSILCQDNRVFSAMAHAGTPCPFNGQIGDAALAEWNKYEQERPDFEEYTKTLRYMEKVDNQIAIKEEVEANPNAQIITDGNGNRINLNKE